MRKNILSLLVIVLIISTVGVSCWFLFGNDISLKNSLRNSLSKILRKDLDSSSESSANVKIINLHSHPQQGEEWIISFETEGQADLTITPMDQATIDDDDFVALYCGDEERIPQILEGDVIYYPNWHCNEKAQVVHYTNKAGRHTFKFVFGSSEFFAYNSAAWFNPAWTKRKKITIQNANVDSTLTDFPLYVDITSDTDIGGSAQADGDDILFTTDDGITQIPHEEEYFNVSTGTATGHYWVKVPSIASGSGTDIYVYYGNSTVPDQQDAENVWTNNFHGVWHMYESGTVMDSTSNDNDGTAVGSVPDPQTGQIYKAQDFDGSGDYFRLPDDSFKNITEGTITAWAYVADTGSLYTIFGSNNPGDAWDDRLEFEVNSGKFRYVLKQNDSYRIIVDTNDSLSAETWHHLAFTNDSSGNKLYVDGSQAAVTYTNGNSSSDYFFDDGPGDAGAGGEDPVLNTIGVMWYVDAFDYGEYKGRIDTLKISDEVLSAAEIKFEYYNQSESDNELTWDSETSYVSPSFLRLKGLRLKGGTTIK